MGWTVPGKLNVDVVGISWQTREGWIGEFMTQIQEDGLGGGGARKNLKGGGWGGGGHDITGGGWVGSS